MLILDMGGLLKEEDSPDDDDLDILFRRIATAAVMPAPGEDEAFIVPLVGPHCSCRGTLTPRRKTVEATCLSLCINVAREVSQLWEAREEDVKQASAEGKHSRLQAFLKEMLSVEMQAKWDASVERSWDECKSLEHLALREGGVLEHPSKDLEEFLRDMDKVEDKSLIVGCLQGRRGDSSQEALLVLLFRLATGTKAYAVFDMHFRGDEIETRGPACAFLSSTTAMAWYLLPLLQHYWVDQDGSSSQSEFSGHILVNRDKHQHLPIEVLSPRPVKPPLGSNLLDDTVEEATREVNSTQEPLLESTTAKAKKGKKKVASEVDRPMSVTMSDAPNQNTLDRQTRLNREFGWQLSLQNKRLDPPVSPLAVGEHGELGATSKGGKAEETDKSRTTKPQTALKNTDEPPASPPSTANASKFTQSSSISRSTSTDDSTLSSKLPHSLAKKDIGWQLALQMAPQGPPPSPEKEEQAQENTGDEVLTPPKPMYASNGNASTGSVDSLGVRKGKKLGHDQESIREELHKSVRADFGWQLGLEAQSYTFPLSPKSPNKRPQPTSTSEWGTLGASSSTTNITQTVIGASFSVKEQESANGGSSPKGKQKVAAAGLECDRCFGPCSATDVIEIAGCRHAHKHCTDCLREFVLLKLDEQQSFPIPCPSCELQRYIHCGAISAENLESLGLSQRELDRFHRLELNSFTDNRLQCPKCLTSATVGSRRDLNNFLNQPRWYECPVRCGFQWCKTCSKEVKPNKPHFCAPKVELKKQRGWRSCPGCRTMIQRPYEPTEFNHIECPTPGCRYNFCYGCGLVICDGVMTTAQSDMKSALARHKKVCRASAGQKGCLIQ